MVVWTGSLIALLVVGILAVVGAAIGVAVALGDRVKSTDTGPGPRLTADPSTVQGIWPAWNGDVVLYPKPPADTTLGGTLTLTPTNITPDTAALWAGATTSLEAARRDGVPLLVASFFVRAQSKSVPAFMYRPPLAPHPFIITSWRRSSSQWVAARCCIGTAWSTPRFARLRTRRMAPA